MENTHPTYSTRGGLTPARIVALTVIAAVAAGLLLVASGGGPERVSVPPNARAGELELKPCTYHDRRADCGTLVVPENRRDPQSRMIALPVKRIRARSAHPGEPIFRLEGGPGKTNMEFPQVKRFANDHDVVLVGYRGVDGSSRLDCPEVESAMKKPRDLLGAGYRRAVKTAFRDCSTRLRADGVDLAGYTLPQRVDDLEAARKALGYRQVDLLSESAGTRSALIYSQRHPSAVHRSVMIGANPPGRFLWDGATSDNQINRYARLCAQARACRSRTEDLAATMRAQAADLPDRWGPFPIHSGNARLGSFFGLMESSSDAAPLAAPNTIDTWLSAAEGDASGLWLLSVLTNVAFPPGQVWGDVAAAARADAAAVRRYYAAGGDRGSILGNAGTEFLFAGGDIVDTWPSNPDDDAYSRVRDSDTETLLIGGNLDGATPPANATRQLLGHLRNGRQVVLSELGHTIDFWSYQPAASTRLITRFLDSGRVDESLYRRRAIDFEPSGKHTSMAKLVAGVMIGLPLLAAIALFGVAARVRRRGRLARWAGAA
ncbi:MAG TPA: alpha/beta fold hydrolase, partial [Solirubrobacteraceae bacterium]|nr:alpha/beta fold hydrolase [Solirubrobacteraceae bacterium]